MDFQRLFPIVFLSFLILNSNQMDRPEGLNSCLRVARDSSAAQGTESIVSEGTTGTKARLSSLTAPEDLSRDIPKEKNWGGRLKSWFKKVKLRIQNWFRRFRKKRERTSQSFESSKIDTYLNLITAHDPKKCFIMVGLNSKHRSAGDKLNIKFMRGYLSEFSEEFDTIYERRILPYRLMEQVLDNGKGSGDEDLAMKTLLAFSFALEESSNKELHETVLTIIHSIETNENISQNPRSMAQQIYDKAQNSLKVANPPNHSEDTTPYASVDRLLQREEFLSDGSMKLYFEALNSPQFLTDMPSKERELVLFLVSGGAPLNDRVESSKVEVQKFISGMCDLVLESYKVKEEEELTRKYLIGIAYFLQAGHHFHYHDEHLEASLMNTLSIIVHDAKVSENSQSKSLATMINEEISPLIQAARLQADKELIKNGGVGKYLSSIPETLGFDKLEKEMKEDMQRCIKSLTEGISRAPEVRNMARKLIFHQTDGPGRSSVDEEIIPGSARLGLLIISCHVSEGKFTSEESLEVLNQFLDITMIVQSRTARLVLSDLAETVKEQIKQKMIENRNSIHDEFLITAEDVVAEFMHFNPRTLSDTDGGITSGKLIALVKAVKGKRLDPASFQLGDYSVRLMPYDLMDQVLASVPGMSETAKELRRKSLLAIYLFAKQCNSDKDELAIAFKVVLESIIRNCDTPSLQNLAKIIYNRLRGMNLLSGGPPRMDIQQQEVAILLPKPETTSMEDRTLVSSGGIQEYFKQISSPRHLVGMSANERGIVVFMMKEVKNWETLLFPNHLCGIMTTFDIQRNCLMEKESQAGRLSLLAAAHYLINLGPEKERSEEQLQLVQLLLDVLNTLSQPQCKTVTCLKDLAKMIYDKTRKNWEVVLKTRN